MKTAEQLKGAIRNIAKDKNVRSQEVLQMFLFERILDRLAASSYKNNFILKGGLLISSMIGISERTTMDMDTTVRGIDMAEDKIERIVKEVLSIDAEDGIHFTYKRIEPIREDDDYNNFRVYMDAEYGKIKNPMKIDITTGDEITPAAVRYDYPLLFEERSIPVMAYTLETILAEKYETAYFLEKDPSKFMHLVKGIMNQEAMAFIASSLSYGKREQFNQKIRKVGDNRKKKVANSL